MTNNLNGLLSIVDFDTLSTFVTEYADKDKGFRERLIKMVTESCLSGTTDSYIEEVKAAFATCVIGENYYRGFYRSFRIDWESLSAAIEKLLKKSKLLLDVGKSNEAAAIPMQTFHSLESIDTDEDSEYNNFYDITQICDNVADTIKTIVCSDSASQELKLSIAEELDKTARNSFFSEYGYYDLSELSQEINALTLSDEVFLELIDRHLAEESKYRLPEWVRQKVEILTRLGRTEEVRQLYDNYLYLPEIRRDVINQEIEAKDYSKALKIIDDGIRLAQKDGSRGTEKSWIKTKIEIYTLTGDIKSEIECCRRMFIEYSGGMEYYHRLKSLVNPKEWKVFLERMINDADLPDFSPYGRICKADIFKEEGESERLFKLITDYEGYDKLDAICEYAMMLREDYSKPLLNIFEQSLKKYAETNANPKAYSKVASCLKLMRRLKDGNDASNLLLEYFRGRYSRRPRMIEELRDCDQPD